MFKKNGMKKIQLEIHMKNRKKKYIIDGHIIWAYTYDDALQHYYVIRRF